MFDAWIEPEVACNWLFSSQTSETSCEMDPRSGGSYKITRIEDGWRYVAVGEYLCVDRSDHLSFTFGMPQFAPDVGTITVLFDPSDRGTAEDGLRPGDEEATLAGWRAMFALLESVPERRTG